MTTIGERIKAVRLRAELAQERFAERLGYSRRSVIKWEQGAAEPPLSILPILRREFDVDPEWVVSGTDVIPKAFFKSIDWERLDALEDELRCICQDIGLALDQQQVRAVGRALFADGKSASEEKRKHLRDILVLFMKERKF